jgi:hypothetical protein
MIKTDNSKNILKVIFCEYGQGLGKIAINWFLLWEAKHHWSILLICLAALTVNSGFFMDQTWEKVKNLQETS